MAIDPSIRINVAHLASKYDRVERYFGGDLELLAVLTKRESLKVRSGQAAQEAFLNLTEPNTFHTTMDEGAWGWNLMVYLRNRARINAAIWMSEIAEMLRIATTP